MLRFTQYAAMQEGKRIFNKQDMAAEKLFTSVAKSVWQKRTYLIFYHLLDNYERSTGLMENTTHRENKEQLDFLQACMQTRPMQYCFRYLVAKACESTDSFANLQA
jgi:poly(U)-specific endoribonuclease